MSLCPHLQDGQFLFGILSADETKGNETRHAAEIDLEMQFPQAQTSNQWEEKKKRKPSKMQACIQRIYFLSYTMIKSVSIAPPV